MKPKRNAARAKRNDWDAWEFGMSLRKPAERNRPLMKAFGRAVREARHEKGIAQEKLSLLADADRTFVSQIERGVYQPTLTTMFKLAGPLGIPASELMRRTQSLYVKEQGKEKR